MNDTDSRDITLEGEVAAVVFRNDDTGFGVIEIAAGPDDEPTRAAGPLSALAPGQPVRLRGRWSEHERYGTTFTTVAYEITAPQTPDGLITFLSSDRFPGVGGTIAERIVSSFGLDAGDVISRSPDRLAEIKGISADLARTISEAWHEAGALPQLVSFLSAIGLSPGRVTDFHRRHGADAVDVIERNPYSVLDVPGVTWAQAEKLARRQGIERTDNRRLQAAAQVVLAGESGSGHTSMDGTALQAAVTRLTGTDAIDARRGMDAGVTAGTIARDDLDGHTNWALVTLRKSEQRIADELMRLITTAPSSTSGAHVDTALDGDSHLTDAQREAVTSSMTHAITVLTGGPGTGKTHTVRTIVRQGLAAGDNIALCAPTGRAAKRMEEMTGHPATTIHRLLEATPAIFGEDDDASFVFSYGNDRRLPQDLVVVDECSMADVELAAALVAAVPDGARLLLVGDTDQLPSVGPGAFLRDVLRSDPALIRRVHLDKVHRQAAQSRIVTLAHELRAGTVDPPTGRDNDVFAVPQSSEGIAERVAEIVATRAPHYYDIAPSDVQVLAPMYRGPAGVDNLNEQLRARLNPVAGRTPVAGFVEGDRVVQTRNDAELDVANGEVGEVAEVDLQNKTLRVAFPAGLVTFTARAARNLRPAWCLTVHKSQGGEWPVVVLVLDRAHRSMLYRELVYTAVTRARRGLLLVGDPGLLSGAAKRSGSGLQHRRTTLVERFAKNSAAFVPRKDDALRSTG